MTNDQIALLLTLIGFASIFGIPLLGYWLNQRYEQMMTRPQSPTREPLPGKRQETATMGALRVLGLASE